MKTCTKCGNEKDLSLFGVSRHGKKGPVYRPSCIECCSAANKVWRMNNKQMLREYDLSRATPERRKQCIEWQYANRPKIAAGRRKRYRENPSPYIIATNNRRKVIINQTPPWYDSKDCAWAYVAAAMVNRMSSTKYVVDHIVPLRGKKASGRHVSWNLTLLEKHENCRKSNKWSSS